MADSNGAPDPASPVAPPEIDVTKPHPARMYDYFLGGHFVPDEDEPRRIVPTLTVDPGVVLVSEWRPGTDSIRPQPSEVNAYGGVARKP